MHKLFKTFFLAVIFLSTVSLYGQTPTSYFVKIKTGKGEAILRLYNETPLHRDNFVKLVKESYYDSLIFHRVINKFMIQGGDPDSRNAEKGAVVGNGGPEYKIPAEIQENLIHKKGVIGAARDNNPEKKSSGSQFYLVQGKVFTPAGLDSIEEFRLKKKMTPLQREIYTTIGGTPHLDGNYTVFGELINGIKIVDDIAALETDERDRPLTDERMYLRLLTRSEALTIEHGKEFKRSFFKRIFTKRPSDDYLLD